MAFTTTLSKLETLCSITTITTCNNNNKLSVIALVRVPNRFFGIRDLAFLNVGIRDFSGKERRYSGLELGTGRGISRFYQARCGKCYSKETRSGKSGVENVQ